MLITLYVDNKTPLTEPVKIVENGKERTLRTVGDKSVSYTHLDVYKRQCMDSCLSV